MTNIFLLRFYTSIFFIIFFLSPIYLDFIYIFFFLLIVFLLSFLEIIKIKLNYIKLLIFLFLIIFLYSYYKIFSNDKGKFLVLWFTIITWLTDTGAYIIGKPFGKKKIMYISPNKTYLGFFGGILLSQLSYYFACLMEVNSLNLNYLTIFYVQLIASILVILGDLLFSFFKRIINIKDYSNLLPGHGGILDRIDGLIFSTIYFYIFFIL